ncbi:MAG: glycosyltransferase [Candidatus Gastranaerophilales bacterium]|nr:glycosyltransferase [Candidatus Gastranaerophilales bacterium]
MTKNKSGKNIKVSVIMSLYNVELYMRTAIESVLNQTLSEIELICVNDGSTDYSLATAQEYAEKNERITVLSYEESKGQAYARNRGMDIAKGKYIGFVDGDDWVEPDMFEKLYENAEKNNSDISFCAAALYNELLQKCDFQNTYYNMSLIPADFDNKVFSHKDTKKLLTGSINVALWNKIYRTDFMNKNKIRFPEYFIYEDMPFFYDAWFKAERISLIRDYGYFYRINRSGSTMSKVGNKVLDRVEMVALTYEMFKELPYFDEIKTNVAAWIIDDLFHRYTLVETRYRKEFFFLMKKMFKNLDLNGVDMEELSKCYCFKEYQNCINMKYEDFTGTLTDTYVKAKQTKQELESEMKASNYKVQTFYENIINEIKTEHERNLKAQEALLKDAYEKRLQSELERRKG